MDWPLAGAVTGVVVLAGLVTAGTVAALRSAPQPVKKAPTFVLLLAPPEASASAIQRPAPSAATSWTVASLPSRADDPTPDVAAKKPIVQMPAVEAHAKNNVTSNQKKAASPT